MCNLDGHDGGLDTTLLEAYQIIMLLSGTSNGRLPIITITRNIIYGLRTRSRVR